MNPTGTKCTTCGYPMVQRDDGVIWCAVYGSHSWVSPMEPRRRTMADTYPAITNRKDDAA